MFDALNVLTDPAPSLGLVYHYTSCSVALDRIMRNRTLRMNSLVATSDPLEFQNYQHVAVSDLDDRDLLMKLVDKGHQINDMIKRVCKIACFSADVLPDASTRAVGLFHKGFMKSRMWSQYADRHRGACLVFSEPVLHTRMLTDIQSIRVPIGSTVDIFRGHVEYDNSLRELRLALSISDSEEELSTTEYERFRKNIHPYLYTKLEDYRDEQEYRITVYSTSFEKEKEIFVDIGTSLEAVILGCRFPENRKRDMLDQAHRLGFDVFQMDWFVGDPDIIEVK